ncbi:MAG: hypothetical protein HUU37_09855 [Bdellovibrionales bacterium]|nr:hypothetical protein [Bdellovibrionales bacterium]
MKYELRHTSDGSLTVYHPGTGECYRSGHAARTESEWVFFRPAVLEHPEISSASPFRVLELGYGLGTNFQFLADFHRQSPFRSLEFTSVDQDLSGAGFFPSSGEAADFLRARSFHRAGFQALLLETTFEDALRQFPENHFHSVFFDPFSPKTEPGSWADEIFAATARALRPGGRLATYSVSRRAKDGLRAAGFSWEKTALPEILHKRNGMLAIRL